MQISLYQIVQFAVILIFSLILSIQDIKRMSVRLYIQWASILCALLCQLIFIRTEIWIYILSSLLMGCFYFTIRKISGGKLGPADVWFGFFQGLFLTPVMIPVCLGVEAVTALIIINKKIGRKAFPFIPFMSFGLIVSYIISIIAPRIVSALEAFLCKS